MGTTPGKVALAECRLGLLSLNRPLQGRRLTPRAAIAEPDDIQIDSSAAAAAITITVARSQDHLRVALGALNFMSIP
jgi:hypothetical protein